MNTANLKLCVVPSNVDDLTTILDYDPINDGKVFSTVTDIKVNKVDVGYSVLYRSDDIKNIDPEVLGNNIIKIFMENLPNTDIIFTITYLFNIENMGETHVSLDIETLNALIKLENKFHAINNPNIPFKYMRSVGMDRIINACISQYKDIDDDDYDDDDDDDEDSSDVYDFFNSIGISGYDDYDDDDDDDEDYDDNVVDFLGVNVQQYSPKHRKNNKIRMDYPQSRVFHEGKNPKRSYNRHGVIICPDKESRKRDEKIIKEFLKHFFPGDSEWKKEFRHDVLKRWMKMYCISKKDLKELEKSHRKSKNSKRNSINTDKTLEFTRRLFNVPIDRWNDPNR